jgi:hypothetical protein
MPQAPMPLPRAADQAGFTLGDGYGTLSEPLRTMRILGLRRKLGTNSSASGIIQSKRGVGYMFALPIEPL